jgi:ion channel-forming bestrophin family protein
MYANRNYAFIMTFRWSMRPFILGALAGLFLIGVKELYGYELRMPWQPLSIIGVAVAFYLGFKNNSSYDRTWEARKIWGSIVNNSRSFGASVISYINGEQAEDVRKELIYRHIAWLVALTYQLRLSRPWEHINERLNIYNTEICDAYHTTLSKSLGTYLSEAEIQDHTSRSNTATHIMKQQSLRLQELFQKGYISDYKHIALQKYIDSFYEDQGKSERIKNFPFPRQYASTALWLTWVFSILVPFGLMDVFRNMEGYYGWLTVPLSGLLIWVFFLMEKIGDYSENPFEGSYNDVPISTISRAVEIDLREMINDNNIPLPIPAINGYQL